MTYGQETHTGHLSYETLLEHVPSTIRLGIYVTMEKADGSIPSEATRDQIFQAFLNKISTIANTTVVSATKRGKFSTPVTPD